MGRELTGDADVVINDVTNTLHRREEGGDEFETACGVTNHVTHDDLRRAPGDRATDDGITRCGRCFSDAGGY